MYNKIKNKLVRLTALILTILILASSTLDLNVSKAEEVEEHKTIMDTINPDENKAEDPMDDFAQKEEVEKEVQQPLIEEESENLPEEVDEEVVEETKDSSIEKSLEEEKAPSTNTIDKSLENLSKEKETEQDQTQVEEQTISIEMDDTTITLRGLMPKDAKVTAKKVSVDLEQVGEKVIFAYDITIFDKDGEEFQPSKSSPIKVDFKNQAIKEANDVNIYHKKDVKAKEEKIENVKVENDEVTFDAKNFSIYLATQKVTKTYNFYKAKDSNELVASANNVQILTKEDSTLLEVEAPKIKNQKFVGWYSKEDDQKLKFTNGELSVGGDFTVDEIINLYPKYEEVYHIYFLDKEERVVTTKEVTANEEVKIEDVVIPLTATESLTAWYYDKDLNKKVENGFKVSSNANITIGDNNIIKLYPKVEEGHYIYFDSQAGSYIKPQFVASGQDTVEPTPPTKPGYEFTGWLIEGTEDSFSFGGKLTSDVNLKATWQGQKVNFTVIYWKQSVKDDKGIEDSNKKTYDYAYSDTTNTAIAGTKVYASSYKPNYAETVQNFLHFNFNNDRNKDENENEIAYTVKGDGSTIVNVYYDRNLMTINFYQNVRVGTSWWGRPIYEWQVTETMTGLYGQTLGENDFTWPDGYWTLRSDGGTHYTFLDSFIFPEGSYNTNNNTMSLYDQGINGKVPVNHFKQNLDGSYPTEPSNATLASGGDFYFSNKYNGFTVSAYKIAGMHDYKLKGNLEYITPNEYLYIRHTRNSYKLNFHNVNVSAKSEDVLFEKPLVGFKDYKPDKPSGINESAEFVGWYKDELLTEEFDFDTEIMPAANLTIYAKWQVPDVNLTVKYGGNQDGPINKAYDSKVTLDEDLPTIIQDGKIVFTGSSKKFAVPENNTWLGWFEQEEGKLIPFNLNQKLQKDTTIVGHYIDNSKYTVSYKDGEDVLFVDSHSYAKDSYAEVLDYDGENKDFIGWQINGKGEIYKAKDKIKVTGNMVLVAVFNSAKPKTKITYKPGIRSEFVDVTEEYPANGKVVLPDASIFGNDTSNLYEFIGWKASDDKIYKAATSVKVDKDGETLTALWAKKVTGKKVWVGDSKKPESVTLILKRDGKNISDNSISLITNDGNESYDFDSAEQVVSQKSDWKATWLVDAQKGSNFTINEVDVDGFIKTINNETLTVTNTPKEVTVTIRKEVTGNMGDKSIDFNFEYTIDEDSKTFQLKDGEEKVILVPFGKTITVTEETSDEYITSVNNEETNVYEYTFNNDTDAGKEITVEFTNNKNAVPNVGLVENTMPMITILLLAMMGIFVGYAYKKRQEF